MPRLSKIGAAALAAFGWTGLQTVNASYLVVAGGGGGAPTVGGGGGAGGYQTGTTSLNPTQSYTVTVGAGGAGLVGGSAIAGNQGSDSSFSVITANGGGKGGAQGVSTDTSGGSSGGAGGFGSRTGTASQGNLGGTSGWSGAGGGGAGGVGADTPNSNANGGAGGAGTANSISGTSVTYAGGGGGGSYRLTGGAGGSGGGGTGGTFGGAGGVSGTANTGGGGGGGADNSTGVNSGGGGSGVVIISYVGAQQFGGGVVTSSGGNTIHTFTTSGTLSPLNSLTASYLIVAGGGAGGGQVGGGGGAGGYLSGSGITIDTNSTYLVTVGSGGTGNAFSGTNGTNSAFSIVPTSAVGGGGGGSSNTATIPGNGGSGGGGGGFGTAIGTGTVGQGNDGGTSIGAGAPNYPGGGGGGASSVGGNATATVAGVGGTGTASSISGTSTTYAAGASGGRYNVGSSNGVAGTANTGNGGSGSSTASAGAGEVGGNGGSGVVIISYPGSTQQMAGGTVTVAGGNVIHTFTSSGYLTPIVLVNNSLRFRESASSYLNRTPTTAGNNQKFTMSVWYKPGNIGTSFTNANFISAGGDGSNIIIAGSGAFGSTVDNRLVVRENNATYQFYWSMVFRDPAAWYHIVLAVDTTQATSSNRAKLYVNGVDQGTFSGTGYALNATTSFNTVTAHYIGAFNSAYYYTSCYFAEYNWIDGQQLTANSFGTSNGLGVWQPIRYGGSYGTNGFYLPFPNSGAVTANYLVVAGGGGGGIGGAGGGGGAGGLRSTVTATGGGGSLESALTLNAGNSYTVTVGAGGAGGISEALGTSGSNSVFSTITSTGGGGGSYASSSGGTPLGSGALSGGSGGGGSAWRNSVGTTSTQSNASGTANQGFAGGSAPTQSTNSIGTGGGGGGAGALGADAVQNTSSGNGGTGVAVAISGSSVTYGGGGGGGGANATAGTGGSGGGGNGANGSAGSSGTANLGGGGGGGSSGSGGSGGSGVVIVSYSGTPKFTGGVVSQVGGNTIHTFTTSGTLNGIGSDYSPNGNNWTANNFSFSSGSTYDSMTDVPTLTSATAANYCVLNPIFNVNGTNVTYSNGNLTFSHPANSGNAQLMAIRGTIALPAGKYYWEYIVGATVNDQVGIGNNVAFGGSPDGTAGARYLNSGAFQSNYTNPSSAASYTTNDIIGVAYDQPNGTLAFYKNNSLQGTITNISTTEVFFPSRSPSSSGTGGAGSFNFGQQPFTYTPPTGFVALNTFNLPTPTIGATASTTANKYFDATLYTGNGTSQSIVNSGSMQPDLVWEKRRDATQTFSNGIIDSVRGRAYSLVTNLTIADQTSTSTNDLTSFNSNGFSIGPSNNLSINDNGGTYVAWQWRANSGTNVTNTAGSITSTVSANTSAGFSVVTYTGNATASTVGHGLGVAPSMVIVKSRSTTGNWNVYHANQSATPQNGILYLNLVDAFFTLATWNNTAPTSSVFSINGSGYGVNNSSVTYVAYCFAQVAGYSAFGSYTGNASTDGPFIFTGFRPRYIMIKSTIETSNWFVYDTARSTYNQINTLLLPSTSQGDYTDSTYGIDAVSNGFKIRGVGQYGGLNQSGGNYIYMAFAESPFKYANAR